MGTRVTRQCRVVALHVDLKPLKIVLAQERGRGADVVVVLVGGWLSRLRLNQKLAAPANLVGVARGCPKERRQVVQLHTHVRVEQGRVPLSAAPEDIALSPELLASVKGLLYLQGRGQEDGLVGARASAVHVPRRREEVRRRPQELLSRGLLELLRQTHHVQEVSLRLFQVPALALRGDVSVVEAPPVHSELVQELEHRIHPKLRPLHLIAGRRGLPRPLLGWLPERVSALPSYSVPKGHTKPQPLSLLPTRTSYAHHLVRVVVPEGEQVRGLVPLKPHIRDICEEVGALN
mmetsp:Transcript_9893/g.34079  ORF Transcript_9893/g.34079 Transcript_9893/m.34079 type:complete len:291 (-) Transcript_9893:172-1044(-)